MNNKTIIDYVLNSPENTNPVILNQMLDELSAGSGEDQTIWKICFYGDFRQEQGEVDVSIGSEINSGQKQEQDELLGNGSLYVYFIANTPLKKKTGQIEDYNEHAIAQLIGWSTEPDGAPNIEFPYIPKEDNETLYPVWGEWEPIED